MVKEYNNKTSESNRMYSTSFDHLSDELMRLDICIHLAVMQRKRGQSSNHLDQLKGLVLSEGEISDLLTRTDDPSTDNKTSQTDDSDVQKLNDALLQIESQIQERRSSSIENGIYLSLPHLSRLFQLTPFEEQCLMICLAPELDRKYEKLYAYLQDDITCKKPTVGLVMDLLCHSIDQKLKTRMLFDQQAPLLKYHLLQIPDPAQEDSMPLIFRSLKLDDRMVNFLLGFRLMDAHLEGVCRQHQPNMLWDKVLVSDEVKKRIQRFFRSHFNEGKQDSQKKVIFYLYGPYGSEKQSIVEATCHDLKIPLIAGDVEKMLNEEYPFAKMIERLGREVVLQPAALCLDNFDCLLSENEKSLSQLKTLFEVIKDVSPLTFLLSNRMWQPRGLLQGQVFIDLELPVPDETSRKELWESFLHGQNQIDDTIDRGALASKFRFTPGQIQEAMAAAHNVTKWRTPDNGRMTIDDLYVACRAQSNQKLSSLARKIDPTYRWDDIVLPPDQLLQLREMCNQVKYRNVVYGNWGFDRKLSYGKGLNALFSGPSGTGKTMAAEIIANELKLDLYKIDLSQVVSKYIGETEKNLDKIFAEATTSNSILFFDEADALFGKRSEVKDAHDRYANIEIGYLLQKMEEYDGIAMLATNLRQNMDDAFVRRLQIIVEFPFPDEEHRRKIWKVIFPREAPLGSDVDFGHLAREVKLSGGNIKNIALAAAFYAAEDNGAIQMFHLQQAAKREHHKLGRTFNERQWDAEAILPNT